MPEKAKYIPADAAAVLGVDLGKLSNKIAWSVITGSKLYKEMQRRLPDKESADALKGIENAGIDVSNTFYLYTRWDDRFAGGNIKVALIPLNDATLWQAYVTRVFKGAKVQQMQHRSEATLADGGIVVADENGRVLSFQEKPKPEEALSNLASTGIYIFEPAVLELIPRDREFDIGSELFPMLVKQGLPFFAQNRPFHWIDIGRVSDYWTVLQRVLSGEVANMRMPGKEVRPGVWVGLNTKVDWDSVEVTGPVYIGSGSRVEAGARIEGPAWLGNGCLLRGGSRLIRSVLFDYTRVNAGCEFKDVIASPQYVVDREGHTFYQGEEGTGLRWGDARA